MLFFMDVYLLATLHICTPPVHSFVGLIINSVMHSFCVHYPSTCMHGLCILNPLYVKSPTKKRELESKMKAVSAMATVHLEY